MLFRSQILMFFSGRMIARNDDKKWAYKVMRNGGYSYNKKPSEEVYYSQTNAGPCFFCSKATFLKIRFEEELWLDKVDYPLGEDQVMYYKMFKNGLKILTIYNSGIIHLDAGHTRKEAEKEYQIIYSDFRFKIIFWHRFIYKLERNIFLNLWNCLCIGYVLSFTLFISIIKLDFNILSIKYKAITDAIKFIHSKEYNILPSLHLS